MNYTRGPWEITFLDKAGWIDICPPDNELPLCSARHYPENVEANAHLIAAAPSMYAALKYARHFMNPDNFDIAFIDAALAKAEGKS